GRWRANPSEAFSVEPDAQLPQSLRRALDTRDRKGVEELVGKDPASNGSLRQLRDRTADPGQAREATLLERLAGRLRTLAGDETPALREGGRFARERPREVVEEAAVARADLDEFDAPGKDLRLEPKLPCESGRERRRDRRRGDEVSRLADPRAACVVAVGGIVERGLHEIGKGDRALASDALPEPFG